MLEEHFRYGACWSDIAGYQYILEQIKVELAFNLEKQG